MKQVMLFVCIGNSCRSQMAEGFARAYGGEVMEAESAGLAPASSISRQTLAVMKEKGIEMESHFPKDLKVMDLRRVNLIVNLSGIPLVGVPAPVETWPVKDPIGMNDKVFREVRDQIEQRVQKLILRLRQHEQA